MNSEHNSTGCYKKLGCCYLISKGWFKSFAISGIEASYVLKNKQFDFGPIIGRTAQVTTIPSGPGGAEGNKKNKVIE